jgi:archaellum biogenesis ATPase FlaH
MIHPSLRDVFPSKADSVVSTGCKELDIILEGGYEKPSMILVDGQQSKEQLAVLLSMLSANQSALPILFTADLSPSSIRRKAKELGIPLPANTVFIDAYSKPSGIKAEDNTFVLDTPASLNDLSLILKDLFAKHEEVLLGFYSLSSILFAIGERGGLDFIRTFKARVESKGAVSMFVIDSSLFKKEFFPVLRNFFDLYIKVEKNAEGIWVLRFNNSEVPFRVSGAGIEVL